MHPHPEPEIAARLVTDEAVPANAARLHAAALNCGWSATLSYARGTSTKRGNPVVDSIALRLFKVGQPRIAAVWVEGKFDNAVTSRLAPLNYNELRALVLG